MKKKTTTTRNHVKMKNICKNEMHKIYFCTKTKIACIYEWMENEDSDSFWPQLKYCCRNFRLCFENGFVNKRICHIHSTFALFKCTTKKKKKKNQ